MFESIDKRIDSINNAFNKADAIASNAQLSVVTRLISRCIYSIVISWETWLLQLESSKLKDTDIKQYYTNLTEQVNSELSNGLGDTFQQSYEKGVKLKAIWDKNAKRNVDGKLVHKDLQRAFNQFSSVIEGVSSKSLMNEIAKNTEKYEKSITSLFNKKDESYLSIENVQSSLFLFGLGVDNNLLGISSYLECASKELNEQMVSIEKSQKQRDELDERLSFSCEEIESKKNEFMGSFKTEKYSSVLKVSKELEKWLQSNREDSPLKKRVEELAKSVKDVVQTVKKFLNDQKSEILNVMSQHQQVFSEIEENKKKLEGYQQQVTSLREKLSQLKFTSHQKQKIEIILSKIDKNQFDEKDLEDLEKYLKDLIAPFELAVSDKNEILNYIKSTYENTVESDQWRRNLRLIVEKFYKSPAQGFEFLRNIYSEKPWFLPSLQDDLQKIESYEKHYDKDIFFAMKKFYLICKRDSLSFSKSKTLGANFEKYARGEIKDEDIELFKMFAETGKNYLVLAKKNESLIKESEHLASINERNNKIDEILGTLGFDKNPVIAEVKDLPEQQDEVVQFDEIPVISVKEVISEPSVEKMEKIIETISSFTPEVKKEEIAASTQVMEEKIQEIAKMSFEFFEDEQGDNYIMFIENSNIPLFFCWESVKGDFENARFTITLSMQLAGTTMTGDEISKSDYAPCVEKLKEMWVSKKK
ncbi:MAG: hypothetical protein JSR80_07335 [Verrucomicrobia bacterium]|nr:hypothetical protein [Verrucomicrobiota bacterium]